PVNDMVPPLCQVLDARSEAVRMQRDAERVGLLEEMGRAPVEQHHGARVELKDTPAAVDRQTGKRVIRRQYLLDAVPHGRHVGVFERALSVRRSQSRGDSQGVFVARW